MFSHKTTPKSVKFSASDNNFHIFFMKLLRPISVCRNQILMEFCKWCCLLRTWTTYLYFVLIWTPSWRRGAKLVFLRRNVNNLIPEFLSQNFLLFFFDCRMKFPTWSCLRWCQIEVSLRSFDSREIWKYVYVRHQWAALNCVLPLERFCSDKEISFSFQAPKPIRKKNQEMKKFRK